MSTLLTTVAYDAAKVKLYLGGLRIKGFAEGTKITVSRNNDLVTPLVGTDGEVSLALSRNRTGTMTVNLQATSESNEWLTTFARQADTTGIVSMPMIIEGSQTAYMTGICWLQSFPEVEYGSEVSTYAWTFGILDAWFSFDSGPSLGNAIGSVVEEMAGVSF